MKFKIFISSNRHEFYNERKIIKESIESDIILNRFFKVFAFEEEPASGKTPEQTYSEAVLESDIYIGLIGSKYGTILESGISPTETEYNLFNADENTYFFLKEAYEREEKTLEFIKRIENKHTYKTFNNQEELIIEIKRSLSDFLDNNMNNTKRNFDKKIIKNSTIEELDEEAYEIFFNMMRDNALKNLKDERTKEESDSVEYISFDYTPHCMNRRNRALVDKAGYCIAYCTQTSGGSAYTIGYAMDNDVEVENIAHQVNSI